MIQGMAVTSAVRKQYSHPLKSSTVWHKIDKADVSSRVKELGPRGGLPQLGPGDSVTWQGAIVRKK
jgi:hypothetical protein